MKIGKDLEVSSIGPALARSDLGKAAVPQSDRCSPKWDSNSFPCEYNLAFLLHHCLVQRMVINRTVN